MTLTVKDEFKSPWAIWLKWISLLSLRHHQKIKTWWVNMSRSQIYRPFSLFFLSPTKEQLILLSLLSFSPNLFVVTLGKVRKRTVVSRWSRTFTPTTIKSEHMKDKETLNDAYFLSGWRSNEPLMSNLTHYCTPKWKKSSCLSRWLMSHIESHILKKIASMKP